MLNDTLFSMNNHEAAVVAEGRRLLCDAVFWKLVLKLL